MFRKYTVQKFKKKTNLKNTNKISVAEALSSANTYYSIREISINVGGCWKIYLKKYLIMYIIYIFFITIYHYGY